MLRHLREKNNIIAYKFWLYRSPWIKKTKVVLTRVLIMKEILNFTFHLLRAQNTCKKQCLNGAWFIMRKNSFFLRKLLIVLSNFEMIYWPSVPYGIFLLIFSLIIESLKILNLNNFYHKQFNSFTTVAEISLRFSFLLQKNISLILKKIE